MTLIRNLTPAEPRKSRYYWPVSGEVTMRTVLILEDGDHYWRAVQLCSGEALMTGFNYANEAAAWATAKGYEVLARANIDGKTKVRNV